MGFQEFYCDSATGSNINAGDDKTVITSTNGDWNNAGANRFTAASGTPFSTVSVGDYASVYLDGATTAVYIGRVTAIGGSGASLDISSTIKGGTAPSAGATGRSCTVGGKWKGPNAGDGFPFNLVSGAMTKVTTSEIPRVNFKNGTTYSVTAGITHAVSTGPIRFEGYSTTPGDGGRATIDGGSTAMTLLTISNGSNLSLINLIFSNNGTTGTGVLVSISAGSEFYIKGCVFAHSRHLGLYIGNVWGLVEECEAYDCNTSNTAGRGGFRGDNNHCTFLRCISHDNTAANANGFSFSNRGTLIDCIAESNGSHGVDFGGTDFFFVNGCDFYNNGGSGIVLSSGASLVVINDSNFIKNGAYGINNTGSSQHSGNISNCGYGSGTAANTSGNTNGLLALVEVGAVTYGSNLLPWVDAPNGDFRINLAAAKGAGRGTFTQTASSYAGAVGYPDIGSNQHQDVGGSGGIKCDGGMVGGMRG